MNDEDPTRTPSLNLGFWLLLIVSVWGLVLLATNAAALPEAVVSKFASNGEPIGSMSKPAFITLWASIMSLLSILFLSLPVLLRWLPESTINLPRKDYWFAPERKEQTLRDIVSSLNWIGVATMLLLVFLLKGSLDVNLGRAEKLGEHFLWIIIGFVLFTATCAIGSLIRFQRAPGSEDVLDD